MGQLILWIFLLVLGLALLVKGADWFVDGAAGIAEKCRVSPLVIGLTVVAFGTSAPELATSITAAVKAYSDPSAVSLSLTNVFGSNIMNILLILGLSALIRCLPVKKVSLWLDIPVLLVASALIVGLGVWGSALNWWDGLVLLIVFAAYMAVLFVNAHKEKKREMLAPPQEESVEKEPKTRLGKWFAAMKQKTWFLVILTIVGLGMVVGGGMLLVEGATFIAEDYLHVDPGIVGLTVVAIGTSLPELVTSVVAAVKKKTDIAVGNVIGSNIFNIMLVAGVASLVHPLPFEMNRLVDALVALGAAVLLYACALIGRKKIGRIAGAIMLLSFIGYYVYLFVTL